MSARQPGASVGFVKAHAYGNDFLFAEEGEVGDAALDALARDICRRQHGVGADGLIVYRRTPAGATMRLLNADGSRAEVSGNGVRCLGALLVDFRSRRRGRRDRGTPSGSRRKGGLKTLALLRAEPPRYTFRAGMGRPRGLREEELAVGGERVRVVVLSVGNPQCVVLSSSMDEVESRFRRLGRLLATHDRFPEGTNVEFATVERPESGPDTHLGAGGSGRRSPRARGACAAAVAAARYGGAAQERRGGIAGRRAARRLDGGGESG